MNPNMWGAAQPQQMRNMQQGGQDPASRWLQQQGQMQARPTPMPQPGAMQPMRPGVAAQMPHPAMQGNFGSMQAAQGAAFAPHPSMVQAMPYHPQAMGPGGGMQAAQAQAFAPHPAMAQQGWMQNQGAAQGAIHPAMQHALDQQAHLQSQLGAMRVQPAQAMATSPWNAGPTMGGQMNGGPMMGQSPWGRR
jgi:hypothetical protein